MMQERHFFVYASALVWINAKCILIGINCLPYEYKMRLLISHLLGMIFISIVCLSQIVSLTIPDTTSNHGVQKTGDLQKKIEPNKQGMIIEHANPLDMRLMFDAKRKGIEREIENFVIEMQAKELKKEAANNKAVDVKEKSVSQETNK